MHPDMCDRGPMPRPDRTDEAGCEGCKIIAEADETKRVGIGDVADQSGRWHPFRRAGSVRCQDAFARFTTLSSPYYAFTRDQHDDEWGTEEERLTREWDRSAGTRHTRGIWQRPCRFDWQALDDVLEDADFANYQIREAAKAVVDAARPVAGRTRASNLRRSRALTSRLDPAASLPNAVQAEVQALEKLAMGEVEWMTEEEENVR